MISFIAFILSAIYIGTNSTNNALRIATIIMLACAALEVLDLASKEYERYSKDKKKGEHKNE